MKTVILITGMTASGKTTAAEKLGRRLGLPVLPADHIVSKISRELGYIVPSELVLPKHINKFDPQKITNLKTIAYKQLLAELGITGDFIAEGFTLGFAKERELLKSVVGEHHEVMLHIKMPYERWVKFAAMKGYGKHNYVAWDEWQHYFEPPEYQHYEVSDPALIDQPYVLYQQDGFTDKKWQALKLGDLKGDSVLDLGCNDGDMGVYCKQAGAVTVVGVDHNWRCLENVTPKGITAVLREFNQPDWAAELPQFDYVLCLSMLHYVADKPAFIKQCAALTRKTFVLELPISEVNAMCWEIYHTHCLIPTMPLIKEILGKNFARVELVGDSIPPDHSHRVVFKCHKQ